MTFHRLFLLVTLSLPLSTALRAIDTPDMSYAPQRVVLTNEMREAIERLRNDAENNPMEALKAPDRVFLAEITHASEFNTLTVIHHAAGQGNWRLVKKIMKVFEQAGAQTSLNYLNKTDNTADALKADQVARKKIDDASSEDMKNSLSRITNALRMRLRELEGSINTPGGEKVTAAHEWNRTKRAF